jgi:hypothetical protein
VSPPVDMGVPAVHGLCSRGGGVSFAEVGNKTHLEGFCSEIALILQELPGSAAMSWGSGGFCRRGGWVAKFAGAGIRRVGRVRIDERWRSEWNSW